jgi:gliding motility-associated-like protein
VTGNVVRFKLGSYIKNTTLIIDPSLIFSTFSGSKSDNWGYTATYDGEGNFYAGGIAFHDGFPVSNGAFQTTFQGGDNSENASPYDAVIIKFNANGSQRLYATYLGGAGDDQPHSLIVDNNGDLVIAGRTTSQNFPSTQPTFGPGGSFDIFITKLNGDGTAPVGSRKFGGKGIDGVNIKPKYVAGGGANNGIRRNYGDDARSEVIVDGANNIYLASSTQSKDFPVTSGAFQSAMGGGLQDGVVIKTSSNLSNVLFSSFLGGNNDDAAFVLALNPSNNNIYVAGGTVSNDFPGVSSGAVLQNTFQKGECDGYVSIIKNDGTSLIKSSYIGTEGNDLVYGIQFDKFSFPYVMGTTSGNWPVINAPFSQNNGKQFIGKLDQNITKWEYSTKFGKGQAAPDISPTAFLVDRCENVYVSGWGGALEARDGYPNAGTSGLSVTPNAIQPQTDGSDFYFFVLERNATSQLYGTFFGEREGLGDHVDGGTSRFDRQGVIYQAICANCGKKGTFPTTPGVWSPENASQNGAMCNLAAVKIAFELAGVGTGLRSSIAGVVRDTSGCVPLTVDFSDTVAVAKTYKWNFGDGSPEETTTDPAISHTFTTVGNFRVRLIAIDSLTCNIADTSYTNIRVRDDKATLALTFAKLPPCESLNYQFNNTSVAPPSKPFAPNAFIWDFGDGTTSTELNPTHRYAAPGTYLVKLMLLDTIYCNAPDEIDTTVRIAPNVEARFETPSSGCAPYDAVFTNTSLAGQTFTWDFGDGSAPSNEVSPTHTYTTPGNYVVKLTAIDPSTCNGQDDTSFTLTISPKPTANFTYGPQPPEENTPLTFTNNSFDATSFKWDFGDGQELTTMRKDTIVRHNYNKTGTYNVCLIAYNNSGCSDTICQPVQTTVVPVVDVPNAFTPNGDGVNDVVSVRGYGIAKVNWRIYNRWGTLVYQSTDKSLAWNGSYKGTLQPQEVYNYILDVEFTDGEKYQKKGDITLLR